MKTSVIKYRVADFLKQYPPFNELAEADLLRLAASGRVIFHEPEEYIYRDSQQLGPFLWVIQQGTVELVAETPAGEQLRDLMAEGDLLGTERITGGEAYHHTARTASDVILYSIDAALFEELAAQSPGAGAYLVARLSATRQRESATGGSAVKSRERTSWFDAPTPALALPKPLMAAPGASVQEAAAAMASVNGDWIAITDGQNRPLGLLTSRALRDHVAANASAALPIAAIMETSVPTASSGLPAVAYFFLMMRNRRRTLLITDDGTAVSPLRGVMTDTDLALFAGRNPALLLLEILGTGTADRWKRLLDLAETMITEALTEPSQVEKCAQLTAELSRALTEAVVRQAQAELAEAGHPAPRTPHCWLLFGRAGRCDAVLPDLPHIGVVYQDSRNEAADLQNRDYFSAVLGRVLAAFTACGLRVEGSTADNGFRACRSAGEWKQFFSDCIADPIGNSVYLARALFDLQPLFGEAALAEELKQTVATGLDRGDPFIAVMANDTMSSLPPLTFFRGLVVDLDGAQRESLDLEKTALGPITDAARVFALTARSLDATGTLQRLAKAAQLFPDKAAVFEEAAQAFRVITYQQALARFRGQDGEVIRPSALGRFDQRLLKSAFDSIQRLLELTASAFERVA